MTRFGAGSGSLATARWVRAAAVLVALTFWQPFGDRLDAEIYRWQDDNGTWHFTEGPSTVPRTMDTPAAPEAVDSANDQGQPSERVVGDPIQGGMLWQISRHGLRPSYLLGTIHSDDPRVARLKPEVSRHLDACDRFVMEMELTPHVLMQFGAAMVLEEGRDLETVIGSALYEKSVTAMEALGMPEPVVRRLKPWVVMAMLSMPKSSGGTILDMVLHQRAADRGIPTAGLETAAEQLAVFDQLSIGDQTALLTMTLDQLARMPQYFEQLIQAYAADDLQKITLLGRRSLMHAPSDTARRFMQKLNDERNRRMVDRLIPHLSEGNSFIAVGTLHLAGANGLLSLLRRRGYTTRAVRP